MSSTSSPSLPPAAWLAGADGVDVTGLSPARIQAYATRTDGDVHLERRGDRTRLYVS
ncbi:hypothetical protein [Halosegnis longus]|uniref:hypothetical protein n=1 Tax=Halosegnis longus TaxID=2216012 RepID=UPI00129D64AF|nr:hypothetical protein [Halosegnis longus]